MEGGGKSREDSEIDSILHIYSIHTRFILDSRIDGSVVAWTIRCCSKAHMSCTTRYQSYLLYFLFSSISPILLSTIDYLSYGISLLLLSASFCILT